MTGETATLAKFAAEFAFERIPEEVLSRARNTVCDTVGAIIYGCELPWSRMIIRYATTYGSGGKSWILGPGQMAVQPPMAALANGSLAHAFELDGASKPSVGVHPCATIFPACLAVAQEQGFGGRELITAFVAAAEVVLRIGSATNHSNEKRGFHAPGTTGPFGAAVGVAKLFGLDAEKTINAIGIAASLSCGLVQFSRSGSGGMVKRLHFGRANESGVMAANLACRGFTGPHDAIEGEFGFLRVFCDEHDMGQLTKDLGSRFLTMNIYMKRFACHGSAQAPLQALQDILEEHPVSVEDIETIEVYGSHEMLDRHNIPEPKDPMIGQYSVPFSIALAFHRNPRDPRSFDQAAIDDPKIKALAKRVVLQAKKEAGHLSAPATVRILLKNGQSLERSVTHFKGTPEAPPEPADVFEKFSLLTSHCPRAKMDEIFNRLQEIEKEENFDWLRV